MIVFKPDELIPDNVAPFLWTYAPDLVMYVEYSSEVVVSRRVKELAPAFFDTVLEGRFPRSSPHSLFLDDYVEFCEAGKLSEQEELEARQYLAFGLMQPYRQRVEGCHEGE